MEISKKNIKQFTIEILETIVGAIIMAIATSLFLLPNQLSTGGFSGIATITYYLFNIPMGLMNLILNIPMFIFSNYRIGKKFLIKSIVGTASLSVFIDIFDKIEPITTDRFLASVYGGTIIGIGTAIILKVGASTGGTELIANLIKSYKPNITISRYLAIIDIIIVIANVFVFKHIEIGLYSAIAIYLYGKLIDTIFEGVYYTKIMFIISDKSEKISKQIEENVKRGVTGLYGKGMYSGNDKLVLICAANIGDIPRIKSIAQNIDEKCFIVVANAREVLGKGFKESN